MLEPCRGCAIALPRGCHSPAMGCARGGARALPRGCAGGVPLLETAACPGRPMWAEGCAGGVCHSPVARGRARRGAPEGCRCWEPPHALGGLLCVRRGAPEGCAIALPRGCARRGCRCWWPPHVLGGLQCGRRGAPEGCATALPRRCAGGGVPEDAAIVNRRMPWEAYYVGRGVCHSPAEGACRRGVPLLGAAACLGRPPMWAEGCAGGVCHSPAEGACRREAPEVCRCWEPPHALGGFLCGRRGAPEGCAIARPRGARRGCAGGGVLEGDAVGNRRMPCEACYVGGGVRRRGVP